MNKNFCANQTTLIIVIMLFEKMFNATRTMYMPMAMSILLAKSPIAKMTPFMIRYDAREITIPEENHPNAVCEINTSAVAASRIVKR